MFLRQFSSLKITLARFTFWLFFFKGDSTPPKTTLEPKNWSVGRCFSFSKIGGIFTFQPLVFRAVVGFFSFKFPPRKLGEMIQIWWASCFNRRIDWHWGNDPNGSLLSQDWCEFSGMGQGRNAGGSGCGPDRWCFEIAWWIFFCWWNGLKFGLI